MSPKKLPPLYKLFEKAGGDLSILQAKNYAKDPRHLVLLKGYHLQERSTSPLVSSNGNSLPTSLIASESQLTDAAQGPVGVSEGYGHSSGQGKIFSLSFSHSDIFLIIVTNSTLTHIHVLTLKFWPVTCLCY